MMSKRLVAFLALVSTLMMIPAVSATTVKCYQTIVYNDWGVPGPLHSETTVYWKGYITGGFTGTCYFWENLDKNYIVGKTEHFFEDFYIALGDGWISGHDEGVWNFATFKYRAHGWVTDASENYEYLIGCKFSEEGTTTPPVLPITGIGTCFIGP